MQDSFREVICSSNLYTYVQCKLHLFRMITNMQCNKHSQGTHLFSQCCIVETSDINVLHIDDYIREMSLENMTFLMFSNLNAQSK